MPKPVEPTPVEPTPVEPTPVEPTPVEPTPAEAKPAEAGTPKADLNKKVADKIEAKVNRAANEKAGKVKTPTKEAVDKDNDFVNSSLAIVIGGGILVGIGLLIKKFGFFNSKTPQNRESNSGLPNSFPDSNPSSIPEMNQGNPYSVWGNEHL